MPAWLAIIVYAVAGSIALTSFVVGTILFFKCENPYRLKAANWKQKWLWAASMPILWFVIPLSLLMTAMTLVEHPGELTSLGFYQGLLIFALFFFIPFTFVFRLRMAITQFMNNLYDRTLKNPRNQRMFEHSYFKNMRKLSGWFGGKDHARFLEHGFSEEPKASNEKDSPAK